MPMIKSPTAWMLRQDGEAFPVIQHLYGSLECVEETLYAGEWLYKHTSIVEKWLPSCRWRSRLPWRN